METNLLTVGINHHTAPVSLRGKLSFNEQSLPVALSELNQQKNISESAILSTCNRTEIYCTQPSQQPALIIDWLSNFHNLKKTEIEPYLYIHPQAQAVRHVLRVASSLDSMVIGEPQILGQLKSAYQTAVNINSIGKYLNRLFQFSFKSAKKIRSATKIGQHPVSIAYIATQLAEQILGELAGKTALLIGAGETITLTIRHLQEKQLIDIVIANRELAHAEQLAKKFSAKAISLNAITESLVTADIVISATASPLPILGKGSVENAIKKRRHRPIFLLDMAVPGDIEPQIAQLDDAYLYTIDDLQMVILENMKNRQQAAKQAEIIIEDQANEFMSWMIEQSNIDILNTVRKEAESMRSVIIEQALKKLKNGSDPKILLEKSSKELLKKLLHQPSLTLKKMNSKDRQAIERMIEQLSILKK